MGQIRILLKDGSSRNYEQGVTLEQIALDISPRLRKAAVAGLVDGVMVDLTYRPQDGSVVEIVTEDSEEGLSVIRHTAAHIMAQAVMRLFDGVKLGIGPSIEDGFYYDFDLDHRLSPEDLERIEEEMRKIIAEDLPIVRVELPREEALRKVLDAGQSYKAELIEEFEDDTVSFYSQGEFVDLCKGPHLVSTGRLKAFKLLNVAGAYWRGDERNKMLQRVYATAFAKQSDLQAHLTRLEEAKKRDHRRLGRDLDLFSLHEEGPGFPFLHPKGMVIWNELLTYWHEVHARAGYSEIRTPIILNRGLWENSGHWDKYRENMYFTEIDGQDYAVKPMNCPGAILIYRNSLHSYRELPIRYAELGLVHRHEKSGTLHGLMRVRAFTQDDAHIFARPDQIQDEILGVINLIDDFYRTFGFSYHVELSTKPENAIGSDEIWELATESLRAALDARGIDYKVNEGDGAFYGPKIDFHLTDCLGRTWQCGTIQLDFVMPERFDLSYVGDDGDKHRPVMIHRVVFGALERFMGMLIEHFAGAFPVWLSPVQTVVMPVSEAHVDYAGSVAEQLRDIGVRCELDDRNEKLGYRIREARLQKVPYMLVVGDSEVSSQSVSVRARGQANAETVSLDSFIERIKREISERKLTP
ncbi:MAG: threonine--tRNA ligase [Bacillota bacterium]|jgi:threonyl-tRNA synthetase|nr:threonine--tRNA ligase [Bacillota bacterium]HPZ55476.1 threonine--tRNA ligase [Bacillota bacterium]HQD18921.1 threonine--tRNA ligase [Bacillota bacterium]